MFCHPAWQTAGTTPVLAASHAGRSLVENPPLAKWLSLEVTTSAATLAARH